MNSLNTGTVNKDYRYKTEFSSHMEDDDADYRPILRGIISTRCNYDGSKIDAFSEE